jgi:hypothetical protein
MYISGLIAYICATASPWFLELFKPTARARSHGTTWDTTTRQITCLLDTNFADTLLSDPLYDLSGSDAALLSTLASTSNAPGNTSISFNVPITDGASLGFYKETDSISTFRSVAKSALKKKKDKSSISTPLTITSTPTASVSFAPTFLHQKLDGLETRFEQMET